ncbi:MAG TPA: MCE family protein [Myxococcales bacterium]|nr:MCE family protein [Myxococcales bacterium]HIM01935.1 MCE family protein [Myxococcales bacterium]
MEDSRRLSLMVGAFFIVTLGSLAVAVLTLSSESGLFVSYYKIYANFDDVQGLLPGAPVWMAGKEIGRIDEVEFTEFGSERPIHVAMRINRGIQTRVRSDSVATVGTIGVLGDSYIEIRPGSPDGSVLIDGEKINAVSPTNIYAALAQGTDALANVSELARNLNLIVSDVREEGVVTKAASAVSAVSNIILEVENGNGMLHGLVYDGGDGDGVGSIERSLASIESILNEVESGNGMLNSLIYAEDTTGVADIQESLDSLSDILLEVKNGDGLLHALIYDEESGRLSDEAVAAVTRLNSVLEKIEEGEGTLGLLVSDPSLYEDMTMLFGGAQRSVVLRTLVRMATDE